MARTLTKRRGWVLSYGYQHDDTLSNVHTKGTNVKLLTAVDTVSYGDNIPSWRQRIARGDSATTGMNGTRFRVKVPDGYITCTPKLPSLKGSYDYAAGHIMMATYSFPSPFSSENNQANQMATSKLLSSYISGQSRWRGGNFLAEFKETVDLFRKPYKSLFQATGNFFKKVNRAKKAFNEVRDAKAIANAVASLWLSYKFVAKPLAEDCNDAAEALAELHSKNRHDSFPVHGKGKVETSANYTTGTLTVQDILCRIPWSFHRYDKSEYTVRYYGRCLSEPGYKGKLQNFGVDIFDVLPAVWEAIPYSFLVDYFANCNEVLDAMRLWDVRPAWLNKTSRNVVSRIWTAPSGPSESSTASQAGGVGGSAVLSATYVNRAPVSTMPYPRFSFHLPSFTQGLNISALVTAWKTGK